MIVGGVDVTVRETEPNLDVSCVEVAVTEAIPVAAGVKTPFELTLPIPEGPTDQVTVLLKLPVPLTVGVQVDVWFS